MGESITYELGGGGAQRAYTITVPEDAIEWKSGAGSTDVVVGYTGTGGGRVMVVPLTEAVVIAAVRQSMADNAEGKFCVQKNLPFFAYTHAFTTMHWNPVYFASGISGFATPLLSPWAAPAGGLLCDQCVAQWRAGAVDVTLRYTPAMHYVNTTAGVYVPVIITHQVRAQRYPSIYNGNILSNGSNQLNIVTYNTDSVVAEVPDAYQAEWVWDVRIVTPQPSGVYSAYVGKACATALPLVPTGAAWAPCLEKYGILCDSYAYTITGGLGWNSTMYGAVPVLQHHLSFIGYGQEIPSGDAGFTRLIVYTEDGQVPPGIDPGTGSGARIVPCAVAHQMAEFRELLGLVI